MKFIYLSTLLVSATFATAQSQNYIIQLDKAASIDDFIPKFVEDTRTIFHDLLGKSEAANATASSDLLDVFKSFSIGSSFKALNVKLGDEAVVDKIRERFSEVVNIFPDEKIQFNLPVPSGPTKRSAKRNFKDGKTKRALEARATFEEQTGAEWGITRTSERALDLTKPYIYDSRGGAGVTAYIVDDGLNIEHEDFEGRATHGWSYYEDEPDFDWNGGGHGTHVSGIIGGKTYGIAKSVDLVLVQVLDGNGSGTVSAILAGLDWIVAREKGKTNKVVVNMSLGMDNGGSSADTLNEAVDAAVAEGIPFIVAAGNSEMDACNTSPANAGKVFTVGATDKDDAFAYYSNYGKCVDILAPGTDIVSTYIGGTDATTKMSGTSMATPHVVGVAALLLSDLEGGAPDALYSAISEITTPDKITEVPDSATPNQLLFNGQTKTTD